ncbi:hypothetical protein OIE75_39190 [Streptomyces sp. NBC_01723]|uniref:hypothetical protein n=1 Tax=unclassified Streptomyces TaxID=2593676 RepID=UPI00277E6CB3|nr:MULTISPECIES: hypothetical protein [unclassified Streptomyces]MDQ0408363.1 hypothetical protein [Streptomyces sp. DSM 40167]
MVEQPGETHLGRRATEGPGRGVHRGLTAAEDDPSRTGRLLDLVMDALRPPVPSP